MAQNAPHLTKALLKLEAPERLAEIKRLFVDGLLSEAEARLLDDYWRRILIS